MLCLFTQPQLTVEGFSVSTHLIQKVKCDTVANLDWSNSFLKMTLISVRVLPRRGSLVTITQALPTDAFQVPSPATDTLQCQMTVVKDFYNITI